jgi:serine O-acetyltransferase
MAHDPDWNADIARYPKRPFLKEQSIWAIWVYRYGRRIEKNPDGPLKRIQTSVYWALFRLVETITGISISKSVTIGPGLRIWHFGNIFIHPESIIGNNCTLRQGVTIGNRHDNSGVPIIGNNVEFGAYAQILGPIHVGNNCKIGAMSLVLCDVPDNATAVGVPARIILTSIKSTTKGS